MGIKGTDIHQVEFFLSDSVHERENTTVFTSPVSPLPYCSILKFTPNSLFIYMDLDI